MAKAAHIATLAVSFTFALPIERFSMLPFAHEPPQRTAETRGRQGMAYPRLCLRAGRWIFRRWHRPARMVH